MSNNDQPESGHAFIDLGERLRQRGQLDSALSVALAGVARFPALAAAHDLVGRVRADMGDDQGASSAWAACLECPGDHVGALKGLAFLAFRRRDLAEAERRLEAAITAAPGDASLLAALDRIRALPPGADEGQLRIDDPASGVLLFDNQGLRLTGGLGTGTMEHDADAVAAAATGVMREAVRASRLLGLGEWRHVLVEGDNSRIALLPVAPHGGVMVRRSRAAAPGRMLALASRAVRAAGEWIGHNL